MRITLNAPNVPSCKFMYLTTSLQNLTAGFPLFRLTIFSFFGQNQELESNSRQCTYFHLTQEAAGHWQEYNSPEKQEARSSGKVPGNSAPLWRTTVTGYSRTFATSLEKAKGSTMRKCHIGQFLLGAWEGVEGRRKTNGEQCREKAGPW